jgi:hypothetical protein
MKITIDDEYVLPRDTLGLDGRFSTAATDRAHTTSTPSRRLAGEPSHVRPTTVAGSGVADVARSPKTR